LSAIDVSCPGCGAPVRFPIGVGPVAVCDHCSSLVARGDRQPELIGKVAAIVELPSEFALGVQGKYRGQSFSIAGHVQLRHPAGGAWNEWYAWFTDQRWGWIAETQGKIWITFAQATEPGQKWPSWRDLRVGSSIPLVAAGDAEFIVTEKGQALGYSARGELPFRLFPDHHWRYADLSGADGSVATLQYGDASSAGIDLYLGHEVDPAELELSQAGGRSAMPLRRVEGVALNCLHCAGALTLHCPDLVKRLVCPNCGGSLNVENGALRAIEGALRGRGSPRIPLGRKGVVAGVELTVIGFLRRSVLSEGTRYSWDEYLCHSERRGLLWLVHTDGHWSFVEPVGAGRVREDDDGHAYYGGHHFRSFQSGVATVDAVLGEFHWAVALGEKAHTLDYVRPPYMLSREASEIADQVAEIQWSFGRYVEPDEIERAFSLSRLPRPSIVAPHQPFRHRAIYYYWAVAFAVAIALWVLGQALASRRRVLDFTCQIDELADPSHPIVFTDPFELRGWKNLRIDVRTSVSNSWLWLEGDLIDEANGTARYFGFTIEAYHGYEGPDRWTEGSSSRTLWLSAVPAGTYVLRLGFERPPEAKDPGRVELTLEQGAPRPLHFLMAFLAISLLPVAVAIWHGSFESRRWSQSDFEP
jgi:hypothetical protein